MSNKKPHSENPSSTSSAALDVVSRSAHQNQENQGIEMVPVDLYLEQKEKLDASVEIYRGLTEPPRTAAECEELIQAYLRRGVRGRRPGLRGRK